MARVLVTPPVSVVHGSTHWCREASWHRKYARFSSRMPALPLKLKQDRRHYIPRQQHKVTNWPAYEAGLRQRGSLTVWFSDEAVAAWAAEPRTMRGGQPSYSPLAILTALILRTVFSLAYRQAEGLSGSIIKLFGLTLCVMLPKRFPPTFSTRGLHGSSGRTMWSTALQSSSLALRRS
jgi:Transposase DDE domain